MLDLNAVDKPKLLTSLSNIYISIFLFDLVADEIVAIKSNKYIDMWAADPVGVHNKTVNVMKNITLPEHVETILEFVDIATLDERLRDKTDISVVFAGKINGWCRARFIAVDRDDSGKLERVLYTVECIDEEKKRENHLLYLSQTDLMTGITNRGHGEAIIREFLKNGKPGAFCLFDVDHFKSINDLYGHDVGDKVLVAIADVMKAVRRDNDVIMRLGGDEFAMYLMGVMSNTDVEEYVQKLFALVDKIADEIPEIKDTVSVSLGVAFYQDNVDFDELYKKADNAVYTSKRCKGSSFTVE